ncbi:uncharacterized protein ARMOST_22048 [Armillaria ostoyae]|uniref:Uncharacterized protein n=1 Tax=Armillaria ostoyae TaxID=47428 RepID=A0A284SBV4_ARMOS|nr:uncharacterized protein ARMOST_22048 [Armillaria ostoyae]
MPPATLVTEPKNVVIVAEDQLAATSEASVGPPEHQKPLFEVL